MRSVVSLLIASALVFSLCSCSKEEYEFVKLENKNIMNKDGEVYEFLASEESSNLHYIGSLEFIGSIKGEEKTSQHLEHTYQTGLFSIKESESDNLLIRRLPNNEWYSIYRKESLPKLEFTVNNCDRLEFVRGLGFGDEYGIHTTCGEGITDPKEIKAFLSDVRAQEDADSAGLDVLVKKPNGQYENCISYAVIFGYFDEEPYLVTQMVITSYNDLAFTITLDGTEYVFPEKWFQELNCQKYNAE